MVDILLELPDALIKQFEHEGAVCGQSAEDLMREIIEANAPRRRLGHEATIATPLHEEPIVQAAEIEKEYRRLGYRHGWRFITCPQANARTAKLLLVTLNPAGREAHGPSWSQEWGSAYRIESWNGRAPGASTLQRQVQQMFALCGVQDAEVFSAHYVPFRSPSWAELDYKQEAEAFAQILWRWLQPKLSFERIVCVGKDKPARPMALLFGAQLETSLPIGWGDITADRYRLPDGRPLIALPHLSRFGLFGRAKGEGVLRELFEI
jgi:hypothetical protein